MSQSKCNHCGGDVAVRNPRGDCDHLYWPDMLTLEAKIANGLIKLKFGTWYPIESVPEQIKQEGSFILTMKENTKIPFVAAWDDEEFVWYTFNRCYESTVKPRVRDAWEPTHWTPIEPPSNGERKPEDTSSADSLNHSPPYVDSPNARGSGNIQMWNMSAPSTTCVCGGYTSTAVSVVPANSFLMRCISHHVGRSCESDETAR